MTDYIDRQAAIKAIDDLPNCYNGYSDAYDKACIIGVLEELPSAEKTGKWIKNDNGTFSCSLCQSWIPNEQHHYARYCLYCGVRMEADNE